MRKLASIALLGGLGLVGDINWDYKPIEPQSRIQECSFDRFGEIKSERHIDLRAIASGDFDGDGDIDVAILERYNQGLNTIDALVICENKMPQKGKQ